MANPGGLLIPAAFALLGGAVLWLYGGLFDAPALTWDDGVHVFDNPFVATGDVAPLWRAPYFGLYIPLMSSAWAALYALGGGAVWPFRVCNVLLHVANVVLIAQLLRSMLRASAGPMERETSAAGTEAGGAPMFAVLVGTTLFALHPIQVATVAWISGGRDLAATLFALLALWLQLDDGARMQRALHRTRARRVLRDGLSTVLFAAALLCKPQVAAVPLALAMWWWCTARARLWRSIPMLVVWSALVLVVAWLARGAQQAPPTVSVSARLFVALDALGFYARTLLWPHALAADHGRTPQALLADPQQALVGIGVLCGIMALLWRASGSAAIRWVLPGRSGPGPAGDVTGVAAMVLWATLLLPVLGLVPFEYQRVSTVADHYAYLPMLGAALLCAWTVQRAAHRLAQRHTTATLLPRVATLAWSVLFLAGAMTTASRLTVWRGGDAVFYRAMLDANPASYSARTNLAVLLCEGSSVGEGLALLDGIPAGAAHDAPVLANRAFCLVRAGRMPDAMALAALLHDRALRDALDRNPRAAVVFVNSLAEALHARGDELSAFAWLCHAQRLQPRDGTIAANLATSRAILRAGGPDVACPPAMPWERLAELAAR